VNDDYNRDYDYDRDLDRDTDDDQDLGTRGAQDQGRGTMDKVSGKVQEGWGHLTGDDSDVAEGKMKQGKGNFEQGAGNVERETDDMLDQ
jgi:uncharacterized protein YjbJ (UPF0337 family)